MPHPKRHSARMRRVRLEVRRLRRESGLVERDVARKIGISHATVSRMENHGRGLTRDALIELLMVYDTPKPVRDALLRMHENADQPGLLDRRDLTVNEDTERWAGFEADATVIHNYEIMLIPGLLQTFQTFPYAGAVIAGFGPRLSEQEVADRTNARIARQALLRRRPRPRLSVVLHEAALRETVGGPEVMRAQLVHLTEMSERPDMTIRALPFGAGAHPGMNGPFVIMDYANLPSLVLLENTVADLYLEEKADIAAYRLAWQGIQAAAHSPERSVDLVTEIAARLS